YDAVSLVRDVGPPPAPKAAIELARGCVRGEHPVEFFGYVYSLERRVIRIPQAWLTELAAVLPPGIDAASAIRLHAAALDRRHVEDAVRFVASLPADERTRIAQTCYRTAHISCSAFPAATPSHPELETRLAEYRPVL